MNIVVKNLWFGYEGSLHNVFEDASFVIDTDWKLGFVGRNGRGKTTFLRLLMGQLEYKGSIISPMEFEYFPFEADELQLAYEVVASKAQFEDWELFREANLLELDIECLYRKMGTLSGGERTKVQLLALFLRQHKFLLIDEPTNHLDAHGRHVLAKYLNAKKGFICVAHDREFLDSCTDHTLALNASTIEVCKGSFSVFF